MLCYIDFVLGSDIVICPNEFYDIYSYIWSLPYILLILFKCSYFF